MPRNPVLDVHRELGAALVERGGTPIPARFGDVAAEHSAVRSAAGVFDLGSAGRVFVGGDGAGRFLDAVLTADVAALVPGRGAYSLVLTPEGRVASDLRVAALDDRFLVLTPSMTRSRVLDLLERRRPVSGVLVEDLTGTWTLLSAQGPRAREVADAALGTVVPDLEPWGGAVIATGAGVPVVVLRSPRTGEDSVDVLVPCDAAADTFRALAGAARACGGLPCGLDALESLRVETGRPAFGAEMDETTLPADIPALAAAVAPAKAGPGVRTGHGAPRHLVGLLCEGRTPPVRGDRLAAGEVPAGRITSAAFSPVLGQAIALALVDAEFAAPGTALVASDGGGATVTPLPFVRGASEGA